MPDTEKTETIVLNSRTIALHFAPQDKREALENVVRLFGSDKFSEGEKAGLRRAVEILKNNSIAQACFRLQALVDGKPE